MTDLETMPQVDFDTITDSETDTSEPTSAHIVKAGPGENGAAIVLVGHSAGGQLALATAARCGELIDGVVAMSAPTDLRLLSNRGSERIDHFVERAPTEQRWALTSPIEMVPTGVATVCVHGEADTTVRPEIGRAHV